MILRVCRHDPAVYTTLLELYLKLDSQASDTTARDKALALLAADDSKFDADHALMLCQMHGFRPGLLRLYEVTSMYDELMRLHTAAAEHKLVVQTAQRFGEQAPSLWLTALTYFADLSPQCDEELREVSARLHRWLVTRATRLSGTLSATTCCRRCWWCRRWR